MREKITTPSQALVAELAKDCRTVEYIQEAIKVLFKDTMQSILKAEMDAHLGYSKHSAVDNNSGNSRTRPDPTASKNRLWPWLPWKPLRNGPYASVFLYKLYNKY